MNKRAIIPLTTAVVVVFLLFDAIAEWDQAELEEILCYGCPPADVVPILAGCAVLDVRNYRFNSLGLLYRWKHKDWKGAYPGEIWEGIGVKYLLGYALKAPLDTDGGSSIVAAFVRNLKSGKDIIVSWRDANDTAKGRNACVIDCSKTPHQYWFWNESSGSPVWTKK